LGAIGGRYLGAGSLFDCIGIDRNGNEAAMEKVSMAGLSGL
jgi:hypothetical protein